MKHSTEVALYWRLSGDIDDTHMGEMLHAYTYILHTLVLNFTSRLYLDIYLSVNNLMCLIDLEFIIYIIDQKRNLFKKFNLMS